MSESQYPRAEKFRPPLWESRGKSLDGPKIPAKTGSESPCISIPKLDLRSTSSDFYFFVSYFPLLSMWLCPTVLGND